MDISEQQPIFLSSFSSEMDFCQRRTVYCSWMSEMKSRKPKQGEILIADVFSNLYYSHLQTDAYKAEFNKLEKAGILKFCFEFPQ